MHAKVTTEFTGRPDEEPVSRMIAVGEVIRGDLAKVAVENKWAKEVPPNEKPANDADEQPKLLADLTVEQLKSLATERSIDLGDATKKADIIAAIELAGEPK